MIKREIRARIIQITLVRNDVVLLTTIICGKIAVKDKK